MMSVLVFWAFVILIGIIWLIIFTLKKLGVNEEMFSFRKPSWKSVLIVILVFIFLFFVAVMLKQVGLAIYYLNESEDGCMLMR